MRGKGVLVIPPITAIVFYHEYGTIVEYSSTS